MDSIISEIKNYEIYILLGLCLISLILLVLQIVYINKGRKLEKKYKYFMKNSKGENIENSIVSYMDRIDKVKAESDIMKKSYEDMNERLKVCMQKYSIQRYRAFEDIGSDLSYSIALLNEDNDGIILTGIYGRNESTTYAKPIEKGISRYDLSSEEKQVLENAINKIN